MLMTDIEHHATNIIESATVHINTGDQRTVDAEYVEYYVSSEYVRAVDSDNNSHISNVETCATDNAK